MPDEILFIIIIKNYVDYITRRSFSLSAPPVRRRLLLLVEKGSFCRI